MIALQWCNNRHTPVEVVGWREKSENHLPEVTTKWSSNLGLLRTQGINLCLAN